MAAEKGSAFLLKIGDGGSPVGYSTVAGLRTTQMTVNGDSLSGLQFPRNLEKRLSNLKTAIFTVISVSVSKRLDGQCLRTLVLVV